MPWLNHPAYVPVRDQLADDLRQRIFFFGRTQPVVFLCGGSGSPRRAQIARFLRRQTSSLVFFAEEVWLGVGGDSDADALEMEKGLAELADIVIVIAESPGSFTELGAFSAHEKLNVKLLPVLDRRYEAEPSFINTGPVRTVLARSRFAPSIYTSFDLVLLESSELEDRIARVPWRRHQALDSDDLRESRKHLLLLIVDLVSILFPSTAEHIEYFVERIVGSRLTARVEELLHLGVALGLLTSIEERDADSDTSSRYFATNGIPNLLRRGPVAHSEYRARVVASIQRIPLAAELLEKLEAVREREPA